MRLVYVPEGEFEMGLQDGLSDERPVHTVYLNAYWIDRIEVTNTMFSAFVDNTGYQADADKAGFSWLFNGSNWEKTSGANWQHPHGRSLYHVVSNSGATGRGILLLINYSNGYLLQIYSDG
jgi:formylglycine-generating enzyme required for sulfatase activity